MDHTRCPIVAGKRRFPIECVHTIRVGEQYRFANSITNSITATNEINLRRDVFGVIGWAYCFRVELHIQSAIEYWIRYGWSIV